MSSREEVTLPATRPKSRKSLGHVPSSHDDQENMTADLKAMSGRSVGMAGRIPSKKSRSKSIGPGGLDALKDTAGNRRKSIAAVPHPPPRSILKPTMPPLREIPAHISTRRSSPKKTTPPSGNQSTLIDFGLDPSSTPKVTGTDTLPNPFKIEGSAAVSETRVTLRTEEEQQTAAREREEKERQELEKDINARRDARRKSLANRRVSFAPEATLHTWDVVVEYQDSTTSSNSTRRASSASGGSTGSPHPRTAGELSSDPAEPPSTPPEQAEEDTIVQSPAHQRNLHQKKRRRSSGIPPMNFNNPHDDVLSSSPLSGESAMDSDEAADDDMDDASISNSDSEADDGTAVSMDGGETTDMSMISMKSDNDSTGSSARLAESLRLAAEQAGTQGIEFDEHGDMELDNADDGVVASFVPFAKKLNTQTVESLQDLENVNPFSPAFKANTRQKVDDNMPDEEVAMEMTHTVGGIVASDEEHEEEEMSMDVTRAFGGIISNQPSSRRKSMPASRRKSVRRRSSGASVSEDETMDFTTAIGGIQTAEDSVSNDDEDMTMEFTSVVGGVLPQLNAASKSRRRSSMGTAMKERNRRTRESLGSATGDDSMDMTVAIGGIMHSIAETATVEIQASEALLPQPSTGKRSRAKKVMELEADLGIPLFPAEVHEASPAANSAANSAPVHTVASDTGSPSLAAFRGKGLRRSTEARHSTTPKSKLSAAISCERPTTPSKQLTPQPARPTTPGKTPPSKNVIVRSSSPKRLFKDEIKAISTTPRTSPIKKIATPSRLFHMNNSTGVATPSFVLTPQPRRSSGVGLDRDGLGSPSVASLLDRRQSIGDQARAFVPSQLRDGGQLLRFEDPRVIENEMDKERAHEADRENNRKIFEREADQFEEEKDATVNLKEMIQSLTPKKKPLKGRKSLHVGAAKGILGKRPAELDDEDDEDNDGVKRLKGHHGSPVKNVKLQAPPSKAETTGRLTRAARKSLEEAKNTVTTPTIISPSKQTVTTPHSQGRFKDVGVADGVAEPISFAEKEPIEDSRITEDNFGDDHIQLQDFLNMTNIRFMELTTTKRRHTIAPKSSTLARDQDHDGHISLEDCVAAGAATIPMLELFQHACHELKNYISEGRKTVREIETETFVENPPLFREYMSATSDMKIVMDNQLKNVKTHARLLSKGMWYEWRMTLLNTLKEALFKTAEGMIGDEDVLDRQQALLDSILPQLSKQAERLERKEADLQVAAEQLANCDQEELSHARQQLISVDADLNSKRRLLEGMRKQLEVKEAEIESGLQRKQVCLEEIREAERVREECRGWTSSEISALKAKVDAIEREHGWTITGVSGTTTSMTYRGEIELVFVASSFLTDASLDKPSTATSNSRLDLWYIGANREFNPIPSTPDKEFFLQTIRDHIRGLPQAITSVRTLLQAVSSAWNRANWVGSNIRMLNLSCPTEVCKTSDSSIAIKSTLVIALLTTKVELTFHLSSQSGDHGISVLIEPSATVVYGERFNEPKMGEFLLSRVGNVVEEKGEETKVSWGAAVAELGEKLLARGRK